MKNSAITCQHPAAAIIRGVNFFEPKKKILLDSSKKQNISEIEKMFNK